MVSFSEKEVTEHDGNYNDNVRFVLCCLYVGYGLALAIYYLIVGKILLGRFFEDSLYYIQEYGRGHDLDVNEEALTNNLKSRRTAVCVVSMVVATLIALAIGLSYRFMGSIPYAVAAMVGTAFGIYYFYQQAYQLESKSLCFVGKLAELQEESKMAIFVCNTKEGQFRYRLDLSQDEQLFRDLVVDREYYAGNYIWQTHIGATDKTEWPEDGW